MRFYQKRNTVFVRFIFNYMILLIITICFGIYAYDQSLNITKKNAIESGMATLEHSKELLDTRMKEVESLVMQLVQDTKVQNFLNIQKPFKGPDYYRMQDMSQNMIPYKYSNNFILNTYIYFTSGVLISPKYATSDIGFMYERVLNYKDMNYAQWRDKLLGSKRQTQYWPVSSVLTNNENHNVITYVQSLPLGSFSNLKGAAIILIKEEEFLKTMGSVYADVEWWYITDKEDNIIISSGYDGNSDFLAPDSFKKPGYIEKTIDGQDMILLHTVSSLNGWSYVSALPSNRILEKVAFIKRLYFWTMLSSFFIGVLISLFMAYRNSKPVRQIVTRLKVNIDEFHSSSGNEFDLIEGTISNLVQNNNELKHELKQQVQAMRATFFERLLRGGFAKLKDIETVRSYMGLELEGEYYAAIAIRIDGYDSEMSKDILNHLDLERVLVNSSIREYLNDNLYSYSMDDDKVVLLLALGHMEGQEYRKQLYNKFVKAMDELKNEYKISIRAGAGKLCDNLINIRNSFEEAMQALEYNNPMNNDKIVFYQDIQKAENEYFYPIDIETRLINLVKMGESAEIMSILNMLKERNFFQSVLSADMAKQFSYEMRGTIVKLKSCLTAAGSGEEAVLKEMIKDMDSAGSMPSMFAKAVKVFEYLCEQANKQKCNRNTVLKKEIIQFIEEQYGKEVLCLASVSSRFNMTDKHFSQFFKEQVGENFSVFLENVRMKHALRILKEDSVSVNDIARKTGYTNVNTFYKAFKRVHGVSPSVYRQHLKAGE